MTHERWRAPENGWQRFWAAGGWWRAVLVAAVYLGLYLGYGRVCGAIFARQIDTTNLLASAPSVILGLALPIILGAITLLVFVGLLRWSGEIFGRQPVPGRRWMWVVAPLLLVPIVLRVAATHWAAYSAEVVLAMLLTGVFIGLAEELLTRGVAVDLLRRAGYGEKVVMLVSSLLFALLHSANALTQPIAVVALTVVYTFGFGVMMYLVMRLTGSIVWAMIIHAATRPPSWPPEASTRTRPPRDRQR